MESMLGSRRRSKKEISVLHCWFRNNHLSPSYSRTFRTQSYWFFITGQCNNSEWILPTYLPYWMCFLIFILSSTMDWYLEVRIQARDRHYSFCLLIPETKGIKIFQRLTSITTSCTIFAQCLEETSKRGIFGWYQSCDSKRIDILSDSIECNHLSRNISSLLYSKSCETEDWRSLTWKSKHVTYTTN